MTFIIMASISASLADPAGTRPLASALSWLQNTLLGTVALTVAILAVASVGFMMLTGRVNMRHGATVAIGCFILFGASSIASGIQSAVRSANQGADEMASVPQVAPVVIPTSLPTEPRRGGDPYAGASLPSQ